MGNIVKVKTESGFTCSVDVDKLNDWTFAKAAAKVASEQDEAAALRLYIYMEEHMLSAKDSERLEKHIATKDGRIPTDAMMTELADILGKIKEAKNSEPSSE